MHNLRRFVLSSIFLCGLSLVISSFRTHAQVTPQPDTFIRTGDAANDLRLSLACGPTQTAKAYPAVAADEQGRHAIAWLDSRNGRNDLYIRFYNANGAVGTDIRVNQDAPVAYGGTGGRSGAFSVACNNLGDLLIVWERGLEKFPQQNRGTYGQYFNMDGYRVGVNFIITSAFTTFKSRASVAVAPNGNALIAWFRSDGIPEVTHHYGRIVSRGGEAVGGIFEIDRSNDEEIESWHDWLTSQRVIACGNSYYAVVWGELREGQHSIRMQRIDMRGERIGESIEVGAPAVDVSFYAPFITTMWWARALTGWYSRAGSWGSIHPDQRYFFHYRTMTSDGSWLGPVDSVAVRLDEDICIGTDGKNRIYVTGQQTVPIVFTLDTLGHALHPPDTLHSASFALNAPLTELAIPPYCYNSSIPVALGMNTSRSRSDRYQNTTHGLVDRDFRMLSTFVDPGNDSCGGSQSNPAYCVNSVGIGLAMWEDLSQSEPCIAGVLIDHATGSILKEISLRHEGLDGSYYTIHCAARKDGGFIVAYSCTNDAGINNPSYVRALDRFGAPLGEPVLLWGHTKLVELRVVHSGEVHILTSGLHVQRSRFSPDLTLLGMDELMKLNQGNIRNNLLAAAIGPNGQVAVAWQTDTLINSQLHYPDEISLRYWGEWGVDEAVDMAVPLQYPYRLPSFSHQDIAIDEQGLIALATVMEPRDYGSSLPGWTNVAILSPTDGLILRRWNLDSAWAQIDHFGNGEMLCSWNYQRKLRAMRWKRDRDSTAWFELHEFSNDAPHTEWIYHDYCISTNGDDLRLVYESTKLEGTGNDIWTGLRMLDTTRVQLTSQISEELQVTPSVLTETGLVRYRIGTDELVRIGLYDALGRLIRSYVDGIIPSGAHWFSLSLTGLSSGAYYLIMDASKRTVQRVTIVR